MARAEARYVLYGYQMVNGVIVVNEEEAKIVQRIYAERLSGIGVYAIGKALYEEQIPFFSDSRDKSVKKASAILYKSIYAGEGRYPAIVSKEEFDKAQAMKPAAFRKKTTVLDKKEDVPHDITDLKTEYHPNETIKNLEHQVQVELQHPTQDSATVRAMILRLAAEKYDCIKTEEVSS